MKIITNNAINKISSTGAVFSSDYLCQNVLSIHPGKPWISAESTDSLKIDVSAHTEALYLGNIQADHMEYDFTSLSDETWLKGNVHLRITPLGQCHSQLQTQKDLWIDLSCHDQPGRLALKFTSTLDYSKPSTTWRSPHSNEYGAFVSDEQHLTAKDLNLTIGSLVFFESIPTPFRVIEIRGIGSGESSIKLFPSPELGHSTILKVLDPISCGVIRAGPVMKLPNPTKGYSDSRKSYSIRKELSDGSMLQRKQHHLKILNGELSLGDLAYKEFRQFVDQNDSEPFACKVFDEWNEHAGYFMFSQIPTGIFESRRLRKVGFQLREFI